MQEHRLVRVTQGHHGDSSIRWDSTADGMDILSWKSKTFFSFQATVLIRCSVFFVSVAAQMERRVFFINDPLLILYCQMYPQALSMTKVCFFLFWALNNFGYAHSAQVFLFG